MSISNSVILPIDNFEDLYPKVLRGVRLGVLSHPASVNSSLIHTVDIIKTLDKKLFSLTTLFGPQHGYLGNTQDNMIEWESSKHPVWNIPILSLYGKHREPTEEMLSGIDCLLVDMQDVGSRYYTFIWTMYLSMKACEKYGKSIIVCDRPNPITCVHKEGPVLDMNYASFVGMHSIPVRHGKTIGELACLFKEECFPKLDLHVLNMRGYKKNMWYDQTGLPWVMPSPNMPTLDTAVVYPGMCLFEATNISEGRGTTRPFELFGAPFINSEKMCLFLNSLELPGVFFREAHFEPTFHKWAGQICNGAQIHVINRDTYLPIKTAVQILKYLFNYYSKEFKWKNPPYEYEYEKMPIDILLGDGTYRKEYIEILY